MDPKRSGRRYDPRAQGLDRDLTGPTGPIQPVLQRLDPRLASPIRLDEHEMRELVDFLRGGLLDPRARPEELKQLVPEKLPSGRPPLRFQFSGSPGLQAAP